MINVETRKSIAHLRAYYECDFGSGAWDALGSDPERAGRICEGYNREKSERGLIWQPLAPAFFHGWIDQLQSHSEPHHVIAVDIICSPPKSFSIAALAGQEIRGDFIDFQDRATAFVTEEILFNSWTRKGNAVDFIKPLVWKFTHPFNRIREPQLHDHLVVLARHLTSLGDFSLDARPLFSLKSSLETIYHYTLRSQLLAAGYEVRLTGTGIKSWEVGGIDPELISTFSSRSRHQWTQESGRTQRELAAKKRQLMASERGKHPKLPEASLVESRQRWVQVIAGRGCSPWSVPRPKPSPASMEHIQEIFRDMPVMSRTEIFAKMLASFRSKALPFNSLRVTAERALLTAVNLGALCDYKKQVYCHLPTLDLQSQVWTALRAGQGKGRPSRLKVSLQGAKWRDLRKLQAAVESADRIRVVEVRSFPDVIQPNPDPHLISQSDFQAERGTRLVWVSDWSIGDIAGHILALAFDEKLVVVGPQRKSSQKFMGTLLRLASPPTKSELQNRKHLKWRQMSYTVHRGEIVPNSSVLKNEARKAGLGNFCVLAPNQLTAADFALLNSELLQVRRGQKALKLIMDEIIPWPASTVALAGLEPTWFVALSNLPGLARHATRWLVKPQDDQSVTLVRGRYSKTVTLAELKRHSGRSLLTRETPCDLPIGATCVASADFKAGGWKQRKGSYVFPVELAGDGGVIMRDGHRYQPGFRLFTPSLLLREMPVMPVKCLIAQADPRDPLLEMILKSNSAKKVVLLSRDPDALRADIADSILLRLLKKRRQQEEEFRMETGWLKSVLPSTFLLSALQAYRLRKPKQHAKSKKENPKIAMDEPTLD